MPAYNFEAVAEDREVIFKPNLGPQTTFLEASEREVLYGGAAGGGKSYAILADALRDLPHPQFRGLILRRTTEELRELVQKSQELYPKAIPGIKWSERKMEWKSPAGGSLWMSFLDRDQDVSRYQGQSFNYIAFDELTQWPTPFAWNYMRSRLRTTSDLKLYTRATTNPGGPGHCLPFGEVLTTEGWVDIKRVKEGDTVLSVDKTGKQVKKRVSKTIREFYSGNLVSKKGQMVFTENHRLPFWTTSGTVEVRPFTELPGQCKVVRAGAKSGDYNSPTYFVVPPYKTRSLRLKQPDQILYSDYAKLLGWFISEGHTLDRDKEFGISQTKEPQRSEIKKLLIACGFRYRESSTGFQVSSPKWWSYFEQFGKCRDKFLPREIMDSYWLKETFTCLMAGDGHWDSKDSGTYYTTSKQLADDVLEACVRLGYSAKLSARQRAERLGLSYEVSFTSRNNTELTTGNHLYEVATHNSKINCSKNHFEGFVYCLTVPETETFFVRQNGYVWLSGNSWVKKMFIDPSQWGKAFWATDIETGETLQWPKGHTKAGDPLFRRRFIPAKLSDNPYLYDSGDYEANLLSLSENERKKLLEGDWDIVEGAAFPEWNRKIHVVDPYDIPYSWRRFRACDYGYSSYSGVVWFAVTPEEQLVIYRELYVSKVLAADLATMILELEADDGPITYGVLDSSCWHQRGQTGPSIAETMIAQGCRWRPSDRSRGARIAGKNEFHRRLQVDDYTEEPRLVVFSNCTNTIAQLPVIPLDTNNPEDVNTRSEDHLYDAIRYGVMTRPRSTAWDVNTDTAKRYTPADGVFGY